jgi:hypothetical protein
MARRLVAPLALLLAVVSLGINLLLVAQLRRPERWVGRLLESAAGELAGADATFRYDVRIPAGTPLALDIPVSERFVVRVDTVVPLNTRLRVPVRSPFGSYTLNLPIRADIPLRSEVPLHVRHTFQLRTRTTAEILVPVEIRLGDLPWEEIVGRSR